MPEGDRSKLKITFLTREELTEEWQKNISKGGIFLKADSPPAPRERVTVTIEVRDSSQRLELSGEAVHITPQGVGVQLDPLSKEATGAIEKLLAEEEPSAAGGKPSPQSADESIHHSIQNMNRYEKEALARKSGMEARNILIRDRNPSIVMSVLQNPRITVAEIIQITKSQGLTLDIIKHISKNPEWMASEDIRLNLVLNPKTPQPTALSLLKKLSDRNVRMLAKRPIKQQIKGAALKIVLERQGVRK